MEVVVVVEEEEEHAKGTWSVVATMDQTWNRSAPNCLCSFCATCRGRVRRASVGAGGAEAQPTQTSARSGGFGRHPRVE